MSQCMAEFVAHSGGVQCNVYAFHCCVLNVLLVQCLQLLL